MDTNKDAIHIHSCNLVIRLSSQLPPLVCFCTCKNIHRNQKALQSPLGILPLNKSIRQFG